MGAPNGSHDLRQDRARPSGAAKKGEGIELTCGTHVEARLRWSAVRGEWLTRRVHSQGETRVACAWEGCADTRAPPVGGGVKELGCAVWN